jgi:hypothetical protein
MANDIGKAINTRLRELNDTAKQTRSDIESSLDLISTAISQGIEELTSLMAEARNN